MRSIGWPEILILLAVALMVALYLVAIWKICSKAGYPGALALTMLIPLVNVIMLFSFALSDWPILRELRTLRQRQSPQP